MRKQLITAGIITMIGLSACSNKQNTSKDIPQTEAVEVRKPLELIKETEAEIVEITHSETENKETYLKDRVKQFLQYLQNEDYEKAYEMCVETKEYPYYVNLEDFKIGLAQSDLKDFIGNKDPFEVVGYNYSNEVYAKMSDKQYIISIDPVIMEKSAATTSQIDHYGEILLTNIHAVETGNRFYTINGTKLYIDGFEVTPDKESDLTDNTLYSVEVLGYGSHTFKVECENGRFSEYTGTLDELLSTEGSGVYITKNDNKDQEGIRFAVVPSEEENIEISDNIKNLINNIFADYAANPNIETLQKYFIDSDQTNIEVLQKELDRNINNYDMTANNYPVITYLAKRDKNTNGIPTYRIYNNGDIKCYFQGTLSYNSLSHAKQINKFGLLTIRKCEDGNYRIVEFPKDYNTDMYSMYPYAENDWE